MPIAWIVSNQIIRFAFLRVETFEARRNICAEISHPNNGAENIDHNLIWCEVGGKPRTLGRKTDDRMDLSPIRDEHQRNLAIVRIGSGV